VSRDGVFGSLSLVGAISLCCLGFGGLAGAATLSGGGASATVVTTGASGARGALVSGAVTFAAVFVIGLLAKRRLGDGSDAAGGDADDRGSE
jgi:hypothetical protein